MFEESFAKQGPSNPGSRITIKFSVTTASRDAVERQAADAITRATAALDPLGSISQAVVQVGSMVDTGITIIAGAQTFETTWGVLLKKMTLFNVIVTDIAEVFDVYRLVSHYLNAT